MNRDSEFFLVCRHFKVPRFFAWTSAAADFYCRASKNSMKDPSQNLRSNRQSLIQKKGPVYISIKGCRTQWVILICVNFLLWCLFAWSPPEVDF